MKGFTLIWIYISFPVIRSRPLLQQMTTARNGANMTSLSNKSDLNNDNQISMENQTVHDEKRNAFSLIKTTSNDVLQNTTDTFINKTSKDSNETSSDPMDGYNTSSVGIYKDVYDVELEVTSTTTTTTAKAATTTEIRISDQGRDELAPTRVSKSLIKTNGPLDEEEQIQNRSNEANDSVSTTGDGQKHDREEERIFLSKLLDSFVRKLCNISKTEETNILRLTLQLEWIFLEGAKKIPKEESLSQQAVDKFSQSVRKLQICRYEIENSRVSNKTQPFYIQRLGVVRKVTIGLMAAGVLSVLLALYYFGYKLHRKLNPQSTTTNSSAGKTPSKEKDETKPKQTKKRAKINDKDTPYDTSSKHNAAFVNCWM